MSRSYKFHNPEGLYFISFDVGWVRYLVHGCFFRQLINRVLSYIILTSRREIPFLCHQRLGNLKFLEILVIVNRNFVKNIILDGMPINRQKNT